ncbi:MAG TPA: hypothetical protein VKU60_07835 [Chloroflexota bacterium]|nr:hypothetical protein [Chloroflexota bacterium]
MESLLLVTEDLDLSPLDKGDPAGWGPAAVTPERIRAITRLVERYARGDSDFRQLFKSKLDRTHEGWLEIFGERAASIAAKNHDAHYVRLGVIALTLAVLIGDWRDAMRRLPLPYAAAERLGLDPAQVFRAAASDLDEGSRQWVESFVLRPEEAKRPEVMGYESTDGADGLFWKWLPRQRHRGGA